MTSKFFVFFIAMNFCALFRLFLGGTVTKITFIKRLLFVRNRPKNPLYSVVILIFFCRECVEKPGLFCSFLSETVGKIGKIPPLLLFFVVCVKSIGDCGRGNVEKKRPLPGYVLDLYAPYPCL